MRCAPVLCLIYLAVACSGPRLEGARRTDIENVEDLAPWLQSGPVIDADHPELQRLAAELTAGAEDDRSAAVAIHAFVRDAVPFGFTSDFYELRASEVIGVGEGYCHTKGTLFVALLRAAQIPARQHFLDTRAELLDGITSPSTPYVDHSYVEVWLGGRWVGVDSYILDSEFFEAANARLRAEQRLIGYGAHVGGVLEWDGIRDSFSQFVDDGSVEGFSQNDWGDSPRRDGLLP